MYILNKKGFTFIELLLYVALTVILVPFVFSFFTIIQKKILVRISFREQNIRKTIVLDLLRRDLMSSSKRIQDWALQNTIFKKYMINKKGLAQSFWVGWEVVEKGLLRRHGKYDVVTKKWLKKSTSFFGCSIKSLRLIPKNNSSSFCNNITGVIIRYEFLSGNAISENTVKIQDEYVRLRNRIV